MFVTILDKVKNFTLREHLCVAAVGILIISYLFYLLILAPERERLVQVEAQQQTERQRIKVVDDFVRQHPDPDAYLLALDGQITRTNQLLPNNPEIGTFLLQIQQAARDSQVELNRVAPGAFVNKSGYYEIPVEVNVKGSFFQIVDFIKRSESLERLSGASTVTMQFKQGQLECKIPFVIYGFGTAPQQVGVTASSQASKANSSANQAAATTKK